MTELEKTVKLFEEIGLEYALDTLGDFRQEWFSFPSAWRGRDMIEAAAAVFVFDKNGDFAGVGIGDEQSSYIARTSKEKPDEIQSRGGRNRWVK